MHVNYRGELLKLRIGAISHDPVSEPVIDADKDLNLVYFEKANKDLSFTFAGNFICWKEKSERI